MSGVIDLHSTALAVSSPVLEYVIRCSRHLLAGEPEARMVVGRRVVVSDSRADRLEVARGSGGEPVVTEGPASGELRSPAVLASRSFTRVNLYEGDAPRCRET